LASARLQEKFIDQIQVVGYIHEWNEEQQKNPNLGGEFVYFLSEKPSDYGVVQPTTGSGTLVDGSKVLHAAKLYRPDVKAPHIDKNQECALTFLQDEDWAVICDNKTISEYQTKDLRMSVVYRARCFKNQADLDLYQVKKDEFMEMEFILGTFKQDLMKKKGLRERYLNSLSKYDLALLIMDTYIVYPLPPIDLAFIPYNYCALPLLYPWTEPFFSLFC